MLDPHDWRFHPRDIERFNRVAEEAHVSPNDQILMARAAHTCRVSVAAFLPLLYSIIRSNDASRLTQSDLSGSIPPRIDAALPEK